MVSRTKPNIEVKVAIIGGGPAGLSCAGKLVEKGFNVCVFDDKPFGGLPAWAIPEFRMPLASFNKRVEELRKKGVEFKSFTVEKVFRLLKPRGTFDCAVLAIGAGNGRTIKAQIIESKKIIDGLDFLKNEKVDGNVIAIDGKKVLVVGGGNASLDVAMSALKKGCDVSLCYRRSEKEMPVFGNELKEAMKTGLKLLTLKEPSTLAEYGPEGGEKKIKVIFSEMILSTEKDSSGRLKPMDSGKKTEDSFDYVLIAAGQVLPLMWLDKNFIKYERNKIIVDENNLTNSENIYACGDCVLGASTIANASISGDKTAEAIIKKYSKK
jgi:glutamate synthase (NADPH/NADH) small chain